MVRTLDQFKEGCEAASLPITAIIPEPSMSLTSGSKLGPYEIQSPLGAGGMGEVYSATQNSLGRQVAIKVLASASALDPERLRRFEQEARAASALNYPNIISIYDVG